MSIDVTDDDILEYAHKLEKKTSRLQVENKKLRDALIRERAWCMAAVQDIPSDEPFLNEAESELRAEMPEVNWDE